MHIPATRDWELTAAGTGIILQFGNRADEFRQLAKQATRTRGGYISFDADLPKKIRTTGEKSQNHHLNGHVGQLAAAGQTSTAAMKMYIKTMASIELGYPTDVIDGVVFPRSEAEASSTECALLIDMCHKYAADKGWALYEGEGWAN